MNNNPTLESIKRSYTAFCGIEPDTDTINGLTLIFKYIDARRSEGATVQEARREVLTLMEDIAAGVAG